MCSRAYVKLNKQTHLHEVFALRAPAFYCFQAMESLNEIERQGCCWCFNVHEPQSVRRLRVLIVSLVFVELTIKTIERTMDRLSICVCMCVFFHPPLPGPWSFVQTTKAGGFCRTAPDNVKCIETYHYILLNTRTVACCHGEQITGFQFNQTNAHWPQMCVQYIDWTPYPQWCTHTHTRCWFEARAVFDTLPAAGSQEGKSIWCDWTLGTWQKSTNRNVSQRWSYRDLRVTVTKSRVKKFFSWLESVIKGLVKLPPRGQSQSLHTPGPAAYTGCVICLGRFPSDARRMFIRCKHTALCCSAVCASYSLMPDPNIFSAFPDFIAPETTAQLNKRERETKAKTNLSLLTPS